MDNIDVAPEVGGREERGGVMQRCRSDVLLLLHLLQLKKVEKEVLQETRMCVSVSVCMCVCVCGFFGFNCRRIKCRGTVDIV